jgi:hypothetical protein
MISYKSKKIYFLSNQPWAQSTNIDEKDKLAPGVHPKESPCRLQRHPPLARGTIASLAKGRWHEGTEGFLSRVGTAIGYLFSAY